MIAAPLTVALTFDSTSWKSAEVVTRLSMLSPASVPPTENPLVAEETDSPAIGWIAGLNCVQSRSPAATPFGSVPPEVAT